MATDKRPDIQLRIIAALIRDVHTTNGVVVDNHELRLDLEKVEKRFTTEGIGFLTKTLPQLCKHFDKVLTETCILDCAAFGFKTRDNSKIPKFLGNLFQDVISADGAILPCPNVTSIERIRQVLLLFYKYELPYSVEQEQQVISQFTKTEDDLSSIQQDLEDLSRAITENTVATYERRRPGVINKKTIVREAKISLSNLFAYFDPKNITPRHGPGAVATRQKLWEKFRFVNVSANIETYYPVDEYFYTSLSHVCDRAQSLQAMGSIEHPARVVLVPKDSRGPRLISCEPVDIQWVQQGLGRALVELVESHPLTKDNVHFTDQQPNQFGALLGSSYGAYATLDLKEASDRVSLSLVRLLFPSHICEALEACRSSATELPDKRILKLKKFAPMGSSLCFPVLALTIWAILNAGAPDQDTKDSILVYGDDVIVPTAHAANAIEQLESFGLAVNRDKSCISGFFRESCGVEAYKGIRVTPVRLRTVWSSDPSPNVYTSWISYANSFYNRQYFNTYDLIVEELLAVYGEYIPDESMHLACPSLVELPDSKKPKRRRTNQRLQCLQWYVWDVKSPITIKQIDGWLMLLRYFTESYSSSDSLERAVTFIDPSVGIKYGWPLYEGQRIFSVREYTRRDTSSLVKRWR